MYGQINKRKRLRNHYFSLIRKYDNVSCHMKMILGFPKISTNIFVQEVESSSKVIRWFLQLNKSSFGDSPENFSLKDTCQHDFKEVYSFHQFQLSQSTLSGVSFYVIVSKDEGESIWNDSCYFPQIGSEVRQLAWWDSQGTR